MFKPKGNWEKPKGDLSKSIPKLDMTGRHADTLWTKEQCGRKPKGWAYRERLPRIRSPRRQEFLRSDGPLQHCKTDAGSRHKSS